MRSFHFQLVDCNSNLAQKRGPVDLVVQRIRVMLFDGGSDGLERGEELAHVGGSEGAEAGVVITEPRS